MNKKEVIKFLHIETVKQVSERFGIPARNLYNLRRRYKIPPVNERRKKREKTTFSYKGFEINLINHSKTFAITGSSIVANSLEQAHKFIDVYLKNK